ncbi:hypothetical protein FHG87_008605 [Trinorchestia longiramus]|nr:hypothetical protein FHG87_008605 [Trinorchestia longiramus]
MTFDYEQFGFGVRNDDTIFRPIHKNKVKALKEFTCLRDFRQPLRSSCLPNHFPSALDKKSTPGGTLTRPGVSSCHLVKFGAMESVHRLPIATGNQNAKFDRRRDYPVPTTASCQLKIKTITMRHIASKQPGTMRSTFVVAILYLVHTLHTAAHPAPPSNTPEQEMTLLDAGRATSAPITEEELNQMIESLLMEAYGDEYEPPAQQPKTTPLSKSKSLPVPKPKRPPLVSKSSNLHSKSFVSAPFRPEDEVFSSIVSPRSQSGQAFLPQQTNKPNLKSITLPRGNPPLPAPLLSFLRNVPEVNRKLSSTATNILRPTKATAKISKLSSSVMPSTVPVRIAQTLTSSDLKGAVLVEQDDQPNILIVDRRTKNKEAKVLNAGKSPNDFQRNSRSPIPDNALSSTPVVVSEPSIPTTVSVAAKASDVDIESLIRPATLISHIKSEDNKPFKSVDDPTGRVTTRPRKNNPSTTDKDVIQLSPEPVAKPQTTAIPVMKQNAAKSFSDNDLFDSPNAFTLPNLPTVGNPPPNPILDVDDVDDEDLFLLELLGSRMNKAGFGSEQSITPAVRLGTTLNLGAPTSTRKSSTRRQKQRENAITISETSQSRASSVPGVFSDEDKVVIDLAAIGGRGTPLPLLTGDSNNQGQFFTGKEIGTGSGQHGSSNIPTPTRLDSLDSPIDSQMTVGDLIRSLNGLNGIQVLSLSDLRNQQNSEAASASSTGTTIAEHLQATMLSKTPASEPQSVGVPLPSLDVSNSVTVQGAVQVASENPGRQFDQPSDIQSDNVFDNFFDESTGNSGTVNDVGVPLSAVADNTGSAAATSESFSATVDDTNGFPLEENNDFNFEEYEDELDDLPPQPESVFRRGISDIFFTKGQWLGTLLGGVVDIGSSIGESISNLFNKSGSSSSS